MDAFLDKIPLWVWFALGGLSIYCLWGVLTGDLKNKVSDLESRVDELEDKLNVETDYSNFEP